jgi:hypothetical protein
VNLAELERMPEVSALLRETVGSVTAAIKVMRFSDDEDIVKFLKTYDAIPVGDLPSVPLEAIILASRVPTKSLIGAILFTFKAVQGHKSALMAIAKHPEVLAKRIEYAMLPGGLGDRDKLDLALGFLPSPKGASINLNFGQRASESKENPSLPDDDDVNDIFPMITDQQESWQENRTRLLKGKD